MTSLAPKIRHCLDFVESSIFLSAGAVNPNQLLTTSYRLAREMWAHTISSVHPISFEQTKLRFSDRPRLLFFQPLPGLRKSTKVLHKSVSATSFVSRTSLRIFFVPHTTDNCPTPPPHPVYARVLFKLRTPSGIASFSILLPHSHSRSGTKVVAVRTSSQAALEEMDFVRILTPDPRLATQSQGHRKQ